MICPKMIRILSPNDHLANKCTQWMTHQAFDRTKGLVYRAVRHAHDPRVKQYDRRQRSTFYAFSKNVVSAKKP